MNCVHLFISSGALQLPITTALVASLASPVMGVAVAVATVVVVSMATRDIAMIAIQALASPVADRTIMVSLTTVGRQVEMTMTKCYASMATVSVNGESVETLALVGYLQTTHLAEAQEIARLTDGSRASLVVARETGPLIVMMIG
jgi:hypothetical protein